MDKTKIITELQRIQEDSDYSSCGHFYEAKGWKFINSLLSISAIGITLISSILSASDWKYKSEAVLILSIINAGVISLLYFYNPQERHFSHLNAGNKYLSLKNDCRRLSQLYADSPEIINLFNVLIAKQDEYNSSSPQISEKAYLKGKVGILKGSSAHTVDVTKKRN